MQQFKKSALTAAIISACLATQASAGESIDLGNGFNFDWKGTAAYSLAARTENQNPDLSTGFGRSTGDANFDKKDLTANGLSLLMEGHLSKNGSGLVMSASAFYDDVYQDDKFTDAAEKYHGGYARLLDFYGYTTFAFGETGYADIRLGNHVVAWGEALFFPSMSLAQGPSDAIKAAVPGAEVKDILLPEEQISTQLEINDKLSLMAHYQYDWHQTIVPEPGSFLSTSEAVGFGATCMVATISGFCPFGARNSDIQPDDAGQWGIGTRYRISENTELGFYYLNYSDRIPLTLFTPSDAGFSGPGTYQVQFFDDIDLYGATFTTTQGMASIAGEITYKKGAPTLVNTTAVPTGARSDILQTNLNGIFNFGRTSFAENATLTTELAYVDIMDVKEAALPGFAFTSSDEPFWGDHGLAFSGSLSLAYPGITENWDLGVPISYARQISGRTLTGGVGGEGDHRFAIGANFTHHRSGIQVGAKYTAYLGDHHTGIAVDKEKKLSDRDYVALTVKYAF